MLCRITLPLAIINSVAIAAIILGAINIDDCVQEPRIPIFLIMFGILMILILGIKTPSISKELNQIFCNLGGGKRSYRAPFARQHTWMKDHKNCVCGFLLLLILLLLACFICLQVWVYTNYNGFYNVGSSKTYVVNCNKDLYLFAFWLIVVVYLSVTLFPLCMCLCALRPRKIDSEKSVTFEKTECATRVLYFISRIFQMKCATDANDFF